MQPPKCKMYFHSMNWTIKLLLLLIIIEGEIHVTSGDPQGSVVGPCLSLFTLTTFQTLLLLQIYSANDIIMYISIKPKTNTAVLQEDLHKLDKWAKN